MTGTPATLRSLRHRNFQLFFAGQLVSLVGTWMQTVAQAWLVYRLTGSPAQLGMISFAGQIPLFLLSPIAGYAADRFNRLRVVFATQAFAMALAALLAGLTLTGNIRIWELYVLSTLLGVANAFDVPARQSLFVDMVGREDLMNAIALNASIYNGARIVGPAVAGILVAQIGEGWCFFLNAVSYVAVLIALRLMKVRPFEARKAVGSPWDTIREGFAYSARTTPFRELLSLLAVISFAGTPYLVLMPIFADQVLHSGARGFGILMGSCGAGALAGALLMASRTNMKAFPRQAFLATTAFPVAIAVFSWSTTFWLSCAGAFAASFAIMIQLNATNTLMQSIVPDRLRGRIVSLYSMMYLGVGPLGAAAAGFAADSIGARLTLTIGAAVCMLASWTYATRLTAIRDGVQHLMRHPERVHQLGDSEPAPEAATL
jgi:MFS family permease